VEFKVLVTILIKDLVISNLDSIKINLAKKILEKQNSNILSKYTDSTKIADFIF